jgi:hypothetical protein
MQELLMSNIRATVPEIPPVRIYEQTQETQVLEYMQEQQQQLENAMEQTQAKQEQAEQEQAEQEQAEQADKSEGAGAVGNEEKPNAKTKKKPGRKPYTLEQRKEADERKAMLKQDPPGQALKRDQKAEKARQKLQA